MSNYKTKLKEIKAFAFDVDGVLTDGRVLATENGDLLRQFDSKDGFSLRMAVLHKYPVAIITGGGSQSICKRFAPLGIGDIYLRSRNKVPDFTDFCNKYGLHPSQVAFVGDDLPDIPVLKICGLAVCPADAAPEVKAVCDFVSLYPGGRGCVRNLIEQVLTIHGRWIFDPAAYSG